MTITINIDTILFLLALLGCATLIALILLLKKLTAFISSVEALLVQNSTNVGLAISKIPAIGYEYALCWKMSSYKAYLI